MEARHRTSLDAGGRGCSGLSGVSAGGMGAPVYVCHRWVVRPDKGVLGFGETELEGDQME